jgi:hypothetical protein
LYKIDLELINFPFHYSPQYATKHRPRTITTCEPPGVISMKHRIVLPDDGSYDPKQVGVNFNVFLDFNNTDFNNQVSVSVG